MGNNQSKYYRRYANQAEKYTIIILSRENQQSLHSRRTGSKNRKATTKSHYRIPRNSTNSTPILVIANQTYSIQQLYRIRQKFAHILYASSELRQEILPLRISMLTTGKNNDRKERRNSALKYQKKLQEIQEKTWRKNIYFIENKNITIPLKTQKSHESSKISNEQANQNINKKTRRINKSQINSNTHHSTQKSRLIIRRQQTVHSGQLSFQLKDFTVQATDLREN